MILQRLLAEHEQQRFMVGNELMWCDPRQSRAEWHFGTVHAVGYNRQVLADLDQLRLEYTVLPTYPGSIRGERASLNPATQLILKAGRDPYRECWQGVVELTAPWEVHLFAYDWELDGNDTQVQAHMNGRFVGDATSEHKHEAVVVLGGTDQVEVRMNLYTFLDWATGVRDTAQMP